MQRILLPRIFIMSISLVSFCDVSCPSSDGFSRPRFMASSAEDNVPLYLLPVFNSIINSIPSMYLRREDKDALLPPAFLRFFLKEGWDMLFLIFFVVCLYLCIIFDDWDDEMSEIGSRIVLSMRGRSIFKVSRRESRVDSTYRCKRASSKRTKASKNKELVYGRRQAFTHPREGCSKPKVWWKRHHHGGFR